MGSKKYRDCRAQGRVAWMSVMERDGLPEHSLPPQSPSHLSFQNPISVVIQNDKSLSWLRDKSPTRNPTRRDHIARFAKAQITTQ